MSWDAIFVAAMLVSLVMLVVAIVVLLVRCVSWSLRLSDRFFNWCMSCCWSMACFLVGHPVVTMMFAAMLVVPSHGWAGGIMTFAVVTIPILLFRFVRWIGILCDWCMRCCWSAACYLVADYAWLVAVLFASSLGIRCSDTCCGHYMGPVCQPRSQ
jgi:hypothetical protein